MEWTRFTRRPTTSTCAGKCQPRRSRVKTIFIYKINLLWACQSLLARPARRSLDRVEIDHFPDEKIWCLIEAQGDLRRKISFTQTSRQPQFFLYFFDFKQHFNTKERVYYYYILGFSKDNFRPQREPRCEKHPFSWLNESNKH